MDIPSVSILFFSPTGRTRRVARYLTEGIRHTVNQPKSVNLTALKDREIERDFSADDVVFVVVPVYSGRVPLPLQSLPQLKGNGAKAVPVVVYGNRAYDDALRELSDVLTQSGFNTVAAAAFVAEHNQITTLAQGRPDARDRQTIADFADKVLHKVLKANSVDELLLKVPGEGDYRPYNKVPTAPVAPADCRHCGQCADVCPLDLIDHQTLVATDPTACIGCFACIQVCPNHGRQFPSPLKEKLAGKIAAMAAANAERKEPSLFI